MAACRAVWKNTMRGREKQKGGGAQTESELTLQSDLREKHHSDWSGMWAMRLSARDNEKTMQHRRAGSKREHSHLYPTHHTLCQQAQDSDMSACTLIPVRHSTLASIPQPVQPWDSTVQYYPCNVGPQLLRFFKCKMMINKNAFQHFISSSILLFYARYKKYEKN